MASGTISEGLFCSVSPSLPTDNSGFSSSWQGPSPARLFSLGYQSNRKRNASGESPLVASWLASALTGRAGSLCGLTRLEDWSTGHTSIMDLLVSGVGVDIV